MSEDARDAASRAVDRSRGRPRRRGGLDVVVRDAPERARYEALVGQEVAGFTDYHRQPGLMTALHTEIEASFQGRGIGSALVREMLDDLRRRDERVFAVCPYVKGYLRRHRGYADLVWKP